MIDVNEGHETVAASCDARERRLLEHSHSLRSRTRHADVSSRVMGESR